MSRVARSVIQPYRLRIAFPATGLVTLVDLSRKLRDWVFDSYRPELHYMRGPGPKWYEKHAHVTSVLPASHHR